MITQTKILNALNFVAKNSQNVKIDHAKIPATLNQIQIKQQSAWSDQIPIDYSRFSETELLRYFILRESLNFCFWDSEPKWKIKYQGNWYSGSYGLALALEKAILSGYNLTDPDYLATIDFEAFRRIFYGTTDIPLIEERFRIIKTLAQELKNILDLPRLFDVKNDEELLNVIVTKFSNFYDVSFYEGRKIYFFKRAILLVTDLVAHVDFIRKKIKNENHMTGCADYKAPQSLRELGILVYAPELAEKIDTKKKIEPNSDIEVEIRANTLVAIEMIKHAFYDQGIKTNSVQIDNALWLLSKQPDFVKHPYHLTKTTKY